MKAPIRNIHAPEFQAWATSSQGRLVRSLFGGVLLGAAYWLRRSGRRGTGTTLIVPGAIAFSTGILDLFPPGPFLGTSFSGSRTRSLLASFEGHQIEEALKSNQIRA